ncbi:hypothetical protein ANO14919_000850 [Xylariales sp. No.14919]|nr:hypothetical protein ANO14919_000850 [Xylariales sp. No.14919]
MSSHRRILQRLKDRFRQRRGSRKRSSQIQPNAAGDTPKQAIEQPQPAENSRETLTHPVAPVNDDLLIDHHVPVNETLEQATEQPQVAKNPQETLTHPLAPVNNASLTKSHLPANETHLATAETEPVRRNGEAGGVQETIQDISEAEAPQEAEDTNPTPQTVAADKETDDKSPIWSRSMQRFAKEEPELYELMKDCIEKFGHESVKNWNTWLNNRQKDPESGWFRRCKAYMPSFRALKGAAMTFSNLDPHKLAPLITAGVFVTIELCFESVDPSTRDKAMNIMLKLKGLINKWNNSEVDLQGLKGWFSGADENLKKIDRIEENLEILYLECLKLISYIYRSGKTRGGRVGASLVSEPTEWEQMYQKLNHINTECSEWKDQAELAVKRKEANITILDKIRIRNEDPEPGHQSVKERTGIDDPKSNAGEWFLETEEFSSWLDGIPHGKTEKRLFWLKGAMGTGKTTLICRVISYLENRPIPGVRLVPYYCYASGTSKESKAPKYETIIRALCRRLAWNSDESIANPARDFDNNTKGDNDASFTVKSTWEPLLKNLVTSSKDTIIFVIDALDECESMEQYNMFLEFLGGFPHTPKGPYFLISSRPHVEVGDYFKSFVQFDAAHQKAKEDMKKFITDQIESRNSGAWATSIFFEDGQQELRGQLEEALYEKAGGMFRWIEIWLGIFFPKKGKRIRQEEYASKLLKELVNLETLDRVENNASVDNWKNGLRGAYKRLWDINGDEQYKPFQLSVFQVVLGAYKPLTPQQLLEAVCLASTNSEKGASLEPDELEGLYCNFLKLDNKGCLNFEHLSAKVFVSEMEKENSNELMFSESECHRVLADIGIKAIAQPNHPIWRDYGIDLVDWGEHAKATLVYMDGRIYQRGFPKKGFPDPEEERKWNNASKWTNIKETITSAYLGRYLFDYWDSHCQRSRGCGELVYRMIALFRDAWSSLEGWILTAAYMQAQGYYGYYEPYYYINYNLRSRALSAVFPLDRQDGSAVGASRFIFMISLGFSPFARDTSKLALLPDFADDDITFPNVEGCVSLHNACIWEDNSLVANLLQFQQARQGSCISLLEARDHFGRIPMHYVGTEDIVTALLEYEMRNTRVQPPSNGPFTSKLLDSRDDRNQTPGIKITETLSDDCLVRIFERYVPELSRSLDEILLTAVLLKKEKAVEIMLKNGANVNYLDKFGRNPSIIAAIGGNVQLLKILFKWGTSLGIASGSLATPLQAAAYWGKIGMVQFMLEERVDINTQAGEYGTALGAAAYSGKVKAVELLLSKGADINIQAGEYGTALGAAVYGGKVEIVELLLSKGADINIQAGEYGTALGAAAYGGKVEIVELLLSKGADVNIQAGKCGTALGAAVYGGKVEIVELLLSKGADVNAKGGRYGTPLGAALNTYWPNGDVIKLLLSKGADTELLNEKDKAKVQKYLR